MDVSVVARDGAQCGSERSLLQNGVLQHVFRRQVAQSGESQGLQLLVRLAEKADQHADTYKNENKSAQFNNL